MKTDIVNWLTPRLRKDVVLVHSLGDEMYKWCGSLEETSLIRDSLDETYTYPEGWGRQVRIHWAV